MLDVIKKICNLPRDFYSTDTKSIIQLLEESGYYKNPDCLNKEGIIKYLNSHPEILNDWENYSSNKRTSEGWFFKSDNDESVIGYYKNGEHNVKKYDSKILACAEFIIKEIQTITKDR